MIKLKPKKDKNTRYGAWYLPKEHWRLMGANEKLTDPKIVKDTENKESKKKTEEIVRNIKISLALLKYYFVT